MHDNIDPFGTYNIGNVTDCIRDKWPYPNTIDIRLIPKVTIGSGVVETVSIAKEYGPNSSAKGLEGFNLGLGLLYLLALFL